MQPTDNLQSLANMLLKCEHPSRCRVATVHASTECEPVVWCAACGAITCDDGVWIAPAIAAAFGMLDLVDLAEQAVGPENQ